MRTNVSAVLAADWLLGCAQLPGIERMTREQASIKAMETRPAPTSDEARLSGYVQSSLPVCMALLPTMQGLQDVKVREAAAYCDCIQGASVEGLTGADLDEFRTPGLDGRYATERGLLIGSGMAARANAAIPACRAKTLATY